MEGNDLATLYARGNSRPEFVPEYPPRRKQRGALPRLDEQQQQGLTAKHPTTSQARVSLQQACFSASAFEDQRSTVLPRGSMTKRHCIAHQQRAVNVSGSSHRVSMQERSHQRGAIRFADGHTYCLEQRGAILAPQDQSLQPPSLPVTGPCLSQGFSQAPPLIAQEPRSLYPFLETKVSFEQMWSKLEAAIQSREGMLTNMKAEMEKSFSLVKSAKLDALKEIQEVETRKAGAMEKLESLSKETGRIKGVREGLEQISTDLSVQVAELNLLVQQVQERQRILELLESLKEHYDCSENENSNYMDKSLQECEVKLASIEKELVCSKRTSEVLEKSALKKIGDLEEIEASCTLSKVQANTDSRQIPSMMRTGERPPGLNEGQEYAVVLKVPKLEPMS